MSDLSVPLSFAAGVLSFFSPCILPLIPGYLSYLSGISIDQISKKSGSRLHVFANSVFFVLGFSLVFAAFGVVLNSLLVNLAYGLKIWASRIGGIVIIAFGLYMLGLLKIPFLEREHKISVRKKFSLTYPTSFIFGAAFAIGWTPCVGAILGSILTLSLAFPGTAFFLLIAYSVGLGIPFLVAGIFTERFVSLTSRLRTFLKYFNIVAGLFLIVLGILVFTNTLNLLANFSILDLFNIRM